MVLTKRKLENNYHNYFTFWENLQAKTDKLQFMFLKKKTKNKCSFSVSIKISIILEKNSYFTFNCTLLKYQ